jgi:5-bromo-4-chloroindolyl phosphate hydrolysis protein
LQIGSKTYKNIIENLDVGIRSMKDFEFINGVGEEALEKIYSLAKKNPDSFDTYLQEKFNLDDES